MNHKYVFLEDRFIQGPSVLWHVLVLHFFHCWMRLHYILYHRLCVHLSLDDHLGCLHLVAIIYNAVVHACTSEPPTTYLLFFCGARVWTQGIVHASKCCTNELYPQHPWPCLLKTDFLCLEQWLMSIIPATQEVKTALLLKTNPHKKVNEINKSWAWWHVPANPATWEVSRLAQA
jgi:hypothetical protein